MNVLIAPNAFKNALDAKSVGEALKQGLVDSKLSGDFKVLPIADGGDGSLDILAHYYQAEILLMEVPDPLGRFVSARYGINSAKGIGIIELAEASGIRWLTEEELNPWIANTKGTGLIMRDLIARGCHHLILTVGGSASIDGGLGILEALGVRFFSEGKLFQPTGPCDFHKITSIDASKAVPLSQMRISLLCDVENEILGEYGAVKVFGPQKGVQKDEIDELEKSMRHWVELLENYQEGVKYMKSGGASGGVPVGLSAFCKVEILQGASEILRLADFSKYLNESEIVITTEGQIDAQTGYGKGPGLVAQIAASQGKKVIGLCGQINDDYNPDESFFDAVFAINSKLYPLNVAISRTRSNLRYMGVQIGNLLAD
jgi:glycerate kinase